MPTGAAVVAAQPGNNSPGFELYYSKYYDRWVFNQYTSDSPAHPSPGPWPTTAGGVKAGEWTHLVGVYARNGRATAAVRQRQARRLHRVHHSPGMRVAVCRSAPASFSGTPSASFPGAIDDVRIFDKPLARTRLTGSSGKQDSTSGRPARAVFQAGRGRRRDAGHRPGRRAAAVPARARRPPGAAGVAATRSPWTGRRRYAATDRRSSTQHRVSFTVSAWAKLPAESNRPATAPCSARAAPRDRARVLLLSSYDRWVFNQYTAHDRWRTSTSGSMHRAAGRGRPAAPGPVSGPISWPSTTPSPTALACTSTDGCRARTPLPRAWYAGGRPADRAARIYRARYVVFFPGQHRRRARLRPARVRRRGAARCSSGGPWSRAAGSSRTAAGTSPVTTPNAVPVRQRRSPSNGGAARVATWPSIGTGSLELDGVTATPRPPSSRSTPAPASPSAPGSRPPRCPTSAVTLMSAEGTKQRLHRPLRA